MKTLLELAVIYARAPIMNHAIKEAIRNHGQDSYADIYSGMFNSYHKSSSAYALQSRYEKEGFVRVSSYIGPKKRFRSEGNLCVMVFRKGDAK